MKQILFALLLGVAASYAQNPQVPITGNLGSAGIFPLLNSGTLVFSSDANHTMVYPEMSASFIKVTSSVSLTATRNLVAPLMLGFQFVIQNATTGGQAIQVIGSSGTGVTIPNGATVGVACDGTNYVLSAGGSVQSAPQFRLYIQPNSGTQAIAGPASTTQNAVTPLLQGKGNTDLFINGAGNNGIANFLSTYPTGYATVPPTSTSTEAVPSTPPSGSYVLDERGNARIRVMTNAGKMFNCLQSPDWQTLFTTSCFYNTFNLTNQDTFFARPAGGVYNGPGFNIGSDASGATPFASAWTTRVQDLFNPQFLTRGIKQRSSGVTHCYGTGDCDDSEGYLLGSGGRLAQGDEGSVGLSRHADEDKTYPHGTVSSGAGLGSTSIGFTLTSGPAYVADGSYLLDITKGTLVETVSSISYPEIFTGGLNTTWASWNLTGTAMTTSTAWGVSQTGTTAAANGKYQVPVSQTIVFSMGNGSFPTPGAYTAGMVCAVAPGTAGPAAEQIQITSVGAMSGGQQSVTFNTRYAYPAGTLFMQGGECGQFATVQTAWRNPIFIVGSLSPTQAVVSACIIGNCTSPGNNSASINLINAIAPVGTAVNFYPGAEVAITTTEVPNVAPLAYNTVNWTVGDTIEDPHLPSQLWQAMTLYAGQTTPCGGDYQECGVLQVNWDGATAPGSLIQASPGSFNASPGPAFGVLYTQGFSTYHSGWYFSLNAPDVVLDLGNSTDKQLEVFRGAGGTNGNRLFSLAGQTGFEMVSNGSVAPLIASNVPPVPTVLAQIPVATNLTPTVASAYTNAVMSGDATMDQTGKVTVTGSNGRPTFLPLAPNALALPTGAIAANTCTAATTLTVTGTGAYQVGSITAWSIASNVATFTETNTLVAGQTVWLSAFGTSTFFNGVNGIVLATGLSGSQFEIAFTHANGSATETGTGTGIGSRIITTPTGDWSGLVGYGSNAGLSLSVWPTVNTVNVKICNGTAASITPGAAILDEEVHP